MSALDRKTLIVGFGISGMSAARHLMAKGVPFDIADQNVEHVRSSLASVAAEKNIKGVAGNAGHNALENDIERCHVVEGVWTDELFLRYERLVVSPGVSTRTENFQSARAAGVEVIGDVELFARSTEKPVIAVTGSNGKSTVVSMAGEILRAAGLRVAVVGNVGLACLDGLDDESIDIYVLELSSFQLETTFSLEPLVSTVLNISEDHMDRYESLDDYAAVKRSVYKNAQSLVVNAEDQKTWSARNSECVTEFSATGEAPWYIQYINGDNTVLRGPDGLAVDASVLLVDGIHNQCNALASMALVSAALHRAESLPIDLPSSTSLNRFFVDGLGRFTGLPHRTELVKRSNGVSWFNDSKGTNVGACVSAIEGLAGPVVLIAGGRGKGADFSPLSKAIEYNCRAVVLIGEDAEKLSLVIGGSVPVYMEESLSDAVSRASAIAQPGDNVLLSPACASFDMFANFEARGNAFAHEVNRLCA